MKVLVIGSGAREHAIAHALMRGGSVSEVTVAPGNPGMELDGIRTTQLNPSNHAALIDFVKNNGYDWVFVGPEVPLIEGIVDDFAAAGIKAFGPNKAAAQIEGSKDFAKQLMERHSDREVPDVRRFGAFHRLCARAWRADRHQGRWPGRRQGRDRGDG